VARAQGRECLFERAPAPHHELFQLHRQRATLERGGRRPPAALLLGDVVEEQALDHRHQEGLDTAQPPEFPQDVVVILHEPDQHARTEFLELVRRQPPAAAHPPDHPLHLRQVAGEEILGIMDGRV